MNLEREYTRLRQLCRIYERLVIDKKRSAGYPLEMQIRYQIQFITDNLYTAIKNDLTQLSIEELKSYVERYSETLYDFGISDKDNRLRTQDFFRPL